MCTRVVTFMYANESDDHSFPQLGIPEGHHTLSHYNPATAEGQAQLVKLQKVDQFYVEHFQYLLQKLKAAGDGERSLLDNSLVVYASGLSYPNKHSRIDIPVVLAGRGGGTLDPGRHVRHPAGTPFSNLLLVAGGPDGRSAGSRERQHRPTLWFDDVRENLPVPHRFATTALPCIFALISTTCFADPPAARPLSAAGAFEKEIQPLLAKYCADCHDAGNDTEFSVDLLADPRGFAATGG